MATVPLSAATTDRNTNNHQQEKRHRSIFDLPPQFFDSCHVLSSLHSSIASISESLDNTKISAAEALDGPIKDENASQNVAVVAPRLTCNTCKAEFESLQDQRSHFKSDIHRFNVKLSVAGKKIVREEDFDELTSDSFKDYDVSSISGSEDEAEKGVGPKGANENFKQNLFIQLNTGERVSVWKSLLMNESENISYESDIGEDIGGYMPCLRENEVIERLKSLIHEPRDNTHLRIVLLASGGHFAGCVFDGNKVVAHKTFHRYVVRAKSGKKQSSKDASGKSVHSAGASLRRHNELALKKDIQELLASWKPYFDASSCVFIYAPSNNRQLLFNGVNPYFSHQHCVVRNVPLTVRRPTLKEAKRLYNQLTQVVNELDEKEKNIKEDSGSSMSMINNGSPGSSKEDMDNNLGAGDNADVCSSYKKSDELSRSSEGEIELLGRSTPLHEAAQSGDVHKVLELLEQGLDPCCKDERGRTPYMLASEKEVRNAFRRFMASNLDKWDWDVAKVPSALTKEMEESQAAKQAEKDAKRKARAKELKKLRKAKEKKVQAQAALSQNTSKTAENQGSTSTSSLKNSQPSSGSRISKEEELKRAQATEREKRAAAAERRIAAAAALNGQGNSARASIVPSTSLPKSGLAGDINCSCCHTSLAGIVPFHRYNYKYCSTSCMHVHREILEDE